MQNKTVYIFFAEENKIEAELLCNDFKNAQLNPIADATSAEKIEQLSQDNTAVALLLVSDNFLKSIDTTQYLDRLLSDAIKERVLSVLTHGRRPKEKGSAQMEVYPTKIKTLNNVMYYRDFWYEKWISLRKRAKQASAKQQDTLNTQKDIAKKMSVGSISTFIRQINNHTSLDWDDLCADNYQQFFNLIGLDSSNIPSDFQQQDLDTFESTEETVSENDQEIAIEQATAEETPDEVVPLSSDITEEQQEQDKKIVPPQEDKVELSESAETTEETDNDHESETDETADETSEVAEEDKAKKVDEPKEESNNVDDLFEQASIFTEATNYEAAKDNYLKILKIDPYNGQALVWLSRLLAAHYPDEVNAAANSYRKSIMVNDENADLYYEYGMLQKEQLQAYSRAADAFKSALEIDSMYEEAYLGLAQCQKEMGMEMQAKANYLQACVLNTERFETAENDAFFNVVRAISDDETATEAEDTTPPNPNSDTVVLVTGASAGIGKAIAKQFIMNGFKVIITARRKERLNRLKSEMEEQFEDANIMCLPFDICNVDAVKNALESLPEAWANIDVLINNAGLAKGFAPVQEGNIDHWEAMINTNVKGLLYMSRMITPGMVKRNKGHVVNLSSVAGTQVYSGGGAYCATKAAVDSLTRSMRLDLYKYNIKVSSISPGHVDATEFAAVRYDDPNKDSIYADFKPLCADDVAETIFYVVTRPDHVNIQDVLIFGTQQASVRDVNRSGRNDK